MAKLPVRCTKCNGTNSIDIERTAVKCPSCGAGINTADVLAGQHPEWFELDQKEKELNRKINEIYDGTDPVSKEYERKTKKAHSLIILAVIISGALASYIAWNLTNENLLIELLAFLFFIPFAVIPMKIISKKMKEKGEEAAKAQHPELFEELMKIRKEKEEYIEKHG